MNSVLRRGNMKSHEEVPMKLVWPSQNPTEWERFLKRATQANWMQSWPYAKAVYMRDFKSTKVALIQKNNMDLGVVAIQEIRVGPIHFLEIHRGPLWFEPVTWDLFLEFAKLLRQTYPRRMLLRLRWLPEWSYEEEKVKELVQYGFQVRPQTYETIVLNLKQGLSEIRGQLDGKWRNGLSKAERSGLKIVTDFSGKRLSEFLSYYQQFKSNKGFLGPSPEFMREEFIAAQAFQNSFLLIAEKSGQTVAGVMIMIHGTCGSYRIGWNSEIGKKDNAHSLLLWSAIEALHSKGIASFDLGGVKSSESPGVTHFKQGMGGQYFRLMGLFS